MYLVKRDLQTAYWSICLPPKWRRVFVFHGGLWRKFRYARLPFGCSYSPPICQWLVLAVVRIVLSRRGNRGVGIWWLGRPNARLGAFLAGSYSSLHKGSGMFGPVVAKGIATVLLFSFIPQHADPLGQRDTPPWEVNGTNKQNTTPCSSMLTQKHPSSHTRGSRVCAQTQHCSSLTTVYKPGTFCSNRNVSHNWPRTQQKHTNLMQPSTGMHLDKPSTL